MTKYTSPIMAAALLAATQMSVSASPLSPKLASSLKQARIAAKAYKAGPYEVNMYYDNAGKPVEGLIGHSTVKDMRACSAFAKGMTSMVAQGKPTLTTCSTQKGIVEVMIDCWSGDADKKSDPQTVECLSVNIYMKPDGTSLMDRPLSQFTS